MCHLDLALFVSFSKILFLKSSAVRKDWITPVSRLQKQLTNFTTRSCKAKSVDIVKTCKILLKKSRGAKFNVVVGGAAGGCVAADVTLLHYSFFRRLLCPFESQKRNDSAGFLEVRQVECQQRF
ncbi:hypothetical protein L596_017284 [Steinernema carpocapsae]|uniref:PNPLA domain-containing protein n=1 Tax=Steinernema carpocapsae TaxID=34508 RepID=A0A4U5N1F9_STECR|nr:hypothetical protein L596_017284 [Steinernema carpocapsae]